VSSDPTESSRPSEVSESTSPSGAGILLLELERVRGALNEATFEKEELEAKLRSADRRLEQLIKQLDEANTRLHAAAQQVQVLTQQLEATNRQLDEAQRGEAELRQLLAHAQAQLDSLLEAGRSQGNQA